VKKIKPKDLDQPKPMERAVFSPVITGRITTVVESKKRPFQIKLEEVSNADESEEGDMRTDEADTAGDNKGLRYLNNMNLISTVYTNSTKSSLNNTPIQNPLPKLQNEPTRKRVLGVQNNLLNMIRCNPDERKPGPIITSEFEAKKEKDVKKNVTTVKTNLRSLF